MLLARQHRHLLRRRSDRHVAGTGKIVEEHRPLCPRQVDRHDHIDSARHCEKNGARCRGVVHLRVQYVVVVDE